MDNILTYVKWRKDIRFEERAFNDVDALIFAVLAYAEWDGIVFDKEMELSQACTLFMKSENRIYDAKRYAYSPEIPLLVEAIKDAPRFQNVKIKNYQTVFDRNEITQFAAVTFVLSDNTTILSYRGTDSSILGWREDFNMTYMEEIPAQKYALAYFENTILPPVKRKLFSSKKENKVYLLGHSKGGNLAMYAALKAKEKQAYIHRVYNFDGPGFLDSFYEKNDVTKILPKIKLYLPNVSIIGRLLTHKEEHVVIEGYDSGLMQHSAFRWQVKTEGFVKADGLKPQSDTYLSYIDKVLLSKTKEQKKQMINAMFDTLDRLNIFEVTDIGTLSLKQGVESVKEFGLLSNEDKRFFLDCIRFILNQTKDFIFTKR